MASSKLLPPSPASEAAACCPGIPATSTILFKRLTGAEMCVRRLCPCSRRSHTTSSLGPEALQCAYKPSAKCKTSHYMDQGEHTCHPATGLRLCRCLHRLALGRSCDALQKTHRGQDVREAPVSVQQGTGTPRALWALKPCSEPKAEHEM